MEWTLTESSFKYNGSPVTRKHAVIKTPIGLFEVHEAVSGKPFIRNPLVASEYISPIGYNNGLEDWFGPSREFISSFEEGIEKSKKMYESYKEKINSFIIN